MTTILLAAQSVSSGAQFTQYVINGLTLGLLIALIALGYTMVYGIIGLINFAHGDLFMLGAFLALTILSLLGLTATDPKPTTIQCISGIAICFAVVPVFCGLLNVSVDYLVYRPLRHAPKLAPLVSAIGVSFLFMNIGQFWGGAGDVNFPQLVSSKNILEKRAHPSDDPESATTHVNTDPVQAEKAGDDAPQEPSAGLRITWKDLLVLGVTIPIMIALTVFVRFTRLGKAMRAVEQNPAAARLMGIDVNVVTSITFFIGGALAGVGSVVFALVINTISFQMGFQNGLYAFTAAVLGGIGNIPGAVLGGLVIGLVRSLGSPYVGENWTGALIFGILIVILVFRPAGLLGRAAQEKV